MLTLLGSLLGFATSFAPKIFDFFQERADRAHELAMIDRQMEQMKLGSQLKLEEINAQADIAQAKAIYRHDAALKSTGFVSNLRASVRPVVAYLLIASFIAIKIASLYALISEGMPVVDALPLIADDQYSALVGAVIAFYFGQRSLARR